MYSAVMVAPIYPGYFPHMMVEKIVPYYPPQFVDSPSQLYPSSPIQYPSSPVPVPCPSSPPSPPSRARLLHKLCLSRKELLTNGFPVKIIDKITVEPNQWQLNRKMYYPKNDTSRTCLRCHTEYHVSESGLQKKSPNPVCGENPFHINDQQPEENLENFKSAGRKSRRNEPFSDRLFALDVEMVYTSLGQEIGRVTVLDDTGASVMDTLVAPSTEIHDPVTQFSGLTLKLLERATTTLEQAQRQVLKCINESSILVGHGLNGDLKALRIVHDRVIDTSVVFAGNGRKPSLKQLTLEHLGYQIQSLEHCSKEDALASLRLVEFALEHPDVLQRVGSPAALG